MPKGLGISQDQELKQPMGEEREIPSREYDWEEAPIEVKIERLRNLTKAFVSTLEELKREVREVLWNHSHEENGEVIIKISSKDKHRLLERTGWDSPKMSNSYI